MNIKQNSLIAAIIIFIAYSCQKDNLITDSSAKLTFSVDTVTFDTVFSTIGSATLNFKVYNPHKQPIEISSVELAGGDDSDFRLNIDGMPENSEQNIELAAKDSMYIFVEVTVDPTNSDSPMVIHDSVVFVTNGNTQDIDLVAYGQDVHLINSETIQSETWTNDKPYLVYNSMLVDSNYTLTIEAGAQLHFHKDSRMYVLGTLLVNGTCDEPVVFQGDRLEDMYDDVPGQWDGIWLWGVDNNHVIDHAIIKNAVIGIQLDTLASNAPTLLLSNTEIIHHTYVGIYAQGSTILSFNNLIADCGYSSVQLRLGGAYWFYNCTLANYWSYSVRSTATLVINNWYEADDETVYVRPMYTADFTNCIIYGSKECELALDSVEINDAFNYKFTNCLMRVDEDIDTTSVNHFVDNIFTTGFSFKDISEHNYQLDTLSEAKDAGDLSIVNQYWDYLESDLKCDSRDSKPDIGAYERIE